MPNVGFPFLGVTLKTLEIDTDKDWAGRGISNLKEISLDAPMGSLNFVWRDAEGNKQIKSIPIGQSGQILISGGESHAPYFGWGWEGAGLEAGLEWTFFSYLYSFVEATIMTPDHKIDRISPVTGDLGTNKGPAAEDFRETTPTVTSVEEAVITTPDHSHTEPGVVECVLEHSVA